MTTHHHPDDELLLGYVTGALSYPAEVVMAAHLTLCPRCRDAAADLEMVGGEILEELEGASITEDGLTGVLARLDEPAPVSMVAPPPEADSEWAQLVPAPLRAMAAVPKGDLSWRRPLPWISVVDLANMDDHGAAVYLMHVRAGRAIPRHSHRGTELTLVLAGGMTDQHGHFRRGDLLAVPPGVTHHPVMDDDEDCLCFSVLPMEKCW